MKYCLCGVDNLAVVNVKIVRKIFYYKKKKKSLQAQKIITHYNVNWNKYLENRYFDKKKYVCNCAKNKDIIKGYILRLRELLILNYLFN